MTQILGQPCEFQVCVPALTEPHIEQEAGVPNIVAIQVLRILPPRPLRALAGVHVEPGAEPELVRTARHGLHVRVARLVDQRPPGSVVVAAVDACPALAGRERRRVAVVRGAVVVAVLPGVVDVIALT